MKARVSSLLFTALLLLVLIGFPATGRAETPNSQRVGGATKFPDGVGTDEIGLFVDSLSDTLTAADLAQMLVGPGVTVSNVAYTGEPLASGRFSGGDSIIGFDSGILLTSGTVYDVLGPNISDSISLDNGLPGDADLDVLSEYPTYDATVLEFDFVPDSSSVLFRFVFASDEYNEYVNSGYNDAFAFFVNGKNCARVEGGPVTINLVNGATHPALFRNNDLDDGGGAINSEMDGLTTVLTCYANVNQAQTNHMKLAIADASDHIFDSAVFLQGASFIAPDCSQARHDVQPLLLVHGWGAGNDLAGDTAGFAQLRNWFRARGWIENCNLFYARGVRDDYGEYARYFNRASISASLKLFRQSVIAFNPSWNGHLDIIGHSYGGLNARFYLESSLYQADKAAGIVVDNLFTLGSPHGGVRLDGEKYPAAAWILLNHLGEDHLPGAEQLLEENMADYNESNSQPAGVCYWLVGGDFMQQPGLQEKAGMLYAIYSLWSGSPNDIGVSIRSSLNLANEASLDDRYPHTVAVRTVDMHGYQTDVNGYYTGDLRSYVSPSTTFDTEIWDVIAHPATSQSANMSRCASAASATAPGLSSPAGAIGPQPILISTGSLANLDGVEANAIADSGGLGAFYVTGVGGSLDFKLRDPNGNLIMPESAELTPGMAYAELTFGNIVVGLYTLDNIGGGTWQVLLTNNNATNVAYEVYLLRDSQLVMASEPYGAYAANTTVTLGATLMNGAIPVLPANAAAVAEVHAPDGVVTTVPLADDGVAPDAAANDGHYSASFHNTAIPGTYQVVAQAQGMLGGQTFSRSAYSAFTVNPVTIALDEVTDEYGLDTNGNSLFDGLAIEVMIDAEEVRTATLSAILQGPQGQTITFANYSGALQVGTNYWTLVFPGKEIRQAGVMGPYRVVGLQLVDEGLLLTLDSAEYDYQTMAYAPIEFEGPMAPVQPFSPTPYDGASDVAFAPVLTWNADDPNGDAMLYELRLGTTNPPPLLAGSQSEPLYFAEDLLPGTVYYWQVVATDADGLSTAGPVWSFSTEGVYTVSGTVTNARTGEPIESVTVYDSEQPDLYALTDSLGQYVLQLSSGTHWLIAEQGDWAFLPEEQAVNVGPAQSGVDFDGYYTAWQYWSTGLGQDAYVNQAAPATNYGSAPILRVRNAASDMNAYLKFSVNLGELEANMCRTFGDSWLSLLVKEPSPDGGSVYAVGDGWNDQTINWNNAPPITGSPIGRFGAVNDETRSYAYLGQVVQGEGAYNFAIRNNSSNSVDYSSLEGESGPALNFNVREDITRTAEPVFYSSRSTGLAPLTVAFYDESEGCPTARLWDFGDGTSSIERNPTHTYTELGWYHVSLTVSNSESSSMGSMWVHVVEPPTQFYISPATNTTIGGIPAQAADILLYDKPSNHWSMVFDASAHGLTKNIGSFAFDWYGNLLLVFSANQTIPGLGTVTPRDIVRFVPNDSTTFPLGAGGFEWYRRGNAAGVGLTTTAESIDALDEDGINDYISTTGAAALPTSPIVKPADEDLSQWASWAGGWVLPLALDGSTVPGLAVEDINGVWLDDETGDYYVTILGAYNLGGVSGTGKNIIRLHQNLDGSWTPSNVPWLAPGAVFPSTIDAIELAR